MIWDFLVRHCLKPVIAATVITLILSCIPREYFQEVHLEVREVKPGFVDNVPEAGPSQHEQQLTNAEEVWSRDVPEEEEDDSILIYEAENYETNHTESGDSSDRRNISRSSVLDDVEEVDDSRFSGFTVFPVVYSEDENSTENSETEYVGWFLDDKDEIHSLKDRFFKLIASFIPKRTCSLKRDSLDFSGGWNLRSVSFLYHTNRTRASCKPFHHPNEIPSLEIATSKRLNEHLNSTAGTGVCTVLFFFSASCPFSRRAAPLMHSAAMYFPTLKFIAVNTDVYSSVASQYGIMGVPVVVLFSEKKFITGWTIPYPDARDTIRTFLMANTDAKYLRGPLTVSFDGGSILEYFNIWKQADFLYMLSFIIVLSATVRLFWSHILLDIINKSLERSGLDNTEFLALLRQRAAAPNPIPAPAEN